MYSAFEAIIFSLLGLSVSTFFYYGFGRWLTSRIFTKLTILETFVLSWVLGISSISVSVFFLGLVLGKTAFWLNTLFFLIALYSLRYIWVDAKKLLSVFKKEKLFSAFLLFSSLTLFATLGLSWITENNSLLIQAGQLHDSVWHLALIEKLLQSLPPDHPSSYLVQVENYHYLYDIAIANLARFVPLPITIYYFQVFPFIISLLLGASVCLIFPLQKSRLAAYLSVFFTFYGGSFAYLIPFFLPGNSWQESSFWVSQTFAVLVNPQLIFSFSIMLVLVWYVWKKTTEKALLPWPVFLSISFLAAVSIGFKSYGWVIALAIIGIDVLHEFLIKPERLKTSSKGIFFVALNCIFLYFIVGFQTNSFLYAPFWYLSSMVESPDRVNNVVWKLLEQHYIANHKILRLAELYIKEFILFVGGNLGTRVIFIFTPILWFFTPAKHRNTSHFWMKIFFAFIVAAGIPLLVLQKNGPVWNSIQFWYYALILANLMAAYFLSNLLQRTRLQIFKFLILSLLIIATTPAFIKTVWFKYTNYEKIPTANIIGLKKSITPDDIVLVCPTGSPYYETALITALTGTQVYFVNSVQLELMSQYPVKEEEKLVKRAFLSSSISSGELEKFLNESNATKIVCTDSGTTAELASLSKLKTSHYTGLDIFSYEK